MLQDTEYSLEQEFYITRLDWVEKQNQSVWKFCIKFDTWNNIENCTVVEGKVLRENHVNIESEIRSSKLSYKDIMNMKLLSVVTPPYFYHSCSTRKKFWEEKFTPVNVEMFGRCNVRKHSEIKKLREVHHLGYIFEFWYYGKDENQIFIKKRLFWKIRKGVHYLSGSQDH